MTTKKREPSQGADRRRAAWMVAAQAGDRAAYEALLRDCVSFIQAVARRQGVPRDRIVLASKHPSMRKYTDFAAA